jgi:O-antigen ligase
VRPGGRTIVAALAATLTGTALAAVPVARFPLDRFGLAKEAVALVGATIVATLALLAARRVRADAADLALAAALALSAVSAAAAVNPWLAARALALSGAALACFLAARALAERGRRAALLRAVGAAVVLAALPAVLTAYGLAPDWADGRRAPAGTFGNRNFLAHVVALGLPALALVAGRSRGRLAAPLWCAGLAAAGAAVVLTRTRAAWLALLGAALLVVLALATSAAGRRAAARFVADAGTRRAALMLAAGVALALALPSRLRWRDPSPYRATAARLIEHDRGSGRGRIIQYRNTLALVRERPLLGVGPGNWMVHYPRVASADDPSYSPGSPVPTNLLANGDWIAAAAERGAPALAALLVAGALLTAGALRAMRADAAVGDAVGDADGDRDGDRAADAAALLATLAAAAIAGSVDAVLQRPGPALVAAVAVAALARRGPVIEGGAPRAGRLAAAACVVVLGAAAGALPLRSIAAGMRYSTDRRPPALERAAATAPEEYRLQFLAGQYWTQVGECGRAAPFVARARRLLPHAPAAVRLAERCAAPADRPAPVAGGWIPM